MAKLLYLVHRLPYPPDKGDKVRSYHLLRHLCSRHEVLLGTFIDDPADEVHLAEVRQWCADLHVERLRPWNARISSAMALASGEPLTLAYFRSRGMFRWVKESAARVRLDMALIFSSSMIQYAPPDLPTLIDFVDVDSAKWTAYGAIRRWPLSWIYQREGRLLLDFERSSAAKAQRSFFATASEAGLFSRAAPEIADRVDWFGNGVDIDRFAMTSSRSSPFGDSEIPIVFTGAMDYWPNIDGVRWFATDILPRIRQFEPRAKFYIVGRSPNSEVLALRSAHVKVTGTVPDVRPYLQHARVVVAPLRVARGIQNKILEAMAMGVPVVTSRAAAGGVDAEQEHHLLVADSASEITNAVLRIVENGAERERLALAGRQRMISHHAWAQSMRRLDAIVQRCRWAHAQRRGTTA